MAVSEIVGVASIAPFMALVSNASLINDNKILFSIYTYIGFSSTNAFIISMGVLVLLILSISTLLSIITTWKLSMFATQVGAEFSERLYGYYLRESWQFHKQTTSAQLSKQIATEVQRFTNSVLLPLMNVNAKFFVALLMSMLLFALNPLVALTGVMVFGLSYFAIYSFIRYKLILNGECTSSYAGKYYRLLGEGFRGIKDIILLGKQSEFEAKFIEASREMARSHGETTALSQIPRYFLELVAFGVLIVLVIYLVIFENNKLDEFLPILSLYAFAGFKLLPAFQQIYAGVAQIKGNISAFDSIKNDLDKAMNIAKDEIAVHKKNKALKITQSVALCNVDFSYQDSESVILNRINLSISANKMVGLVGPSGSGKSTIVDILLGLIAPNSGCLAVDGKKVDDSNVRDWQNLIGFVPQSIFLTEGSIVENVAFGVDLNRIDLVKVNKVLELAHLLSFVNSLPKGVYTKVGEGGAKLSGGQKQRIAIARALYHDADVLIFDEATSALDSLTEKNVMDAIFDFYGKKTIVIVAHRLATLKKCDEIFMIEDGAVVASGNFNDLNEKNEDFKKMVFHSHV
ncbi:ABC transporter ATP-binding protein [Hydrogenovibrio sp. JE_KL2]|uniref:ABC transporter ATP-binding protein n=1 Tax=Hydrogenovibrio sp. JE_KL2 TaxID=2651188 RepID=UPI001C12A66B|nr:ABC transporter ATP-binding protein [Hydrogenovibrio sp. JE_KL2]